jgi:hypothetical protein
MGPGTEEEIARTIDHVAIDRLQRSYADGITRRAWEDVASLFLPGAVVALDLVDRPAHELVGPAEIVGFIAPAVDRFTFFEFVILNSHIELWPAGDRDQATARVFMCELRVPRGQRQRSDAFGLYRDTYRKLDGVWRIAHRRYRSLARFPDGVVFDLPGDL